MVKSWLHSHNMIFGVCIKFLSKKWLVAFIIFAFYPLYSLYNVEIIISSFVGEMTITNVLMYQFGLYYNIYLLFLPLYIFLIGDIIKDGKLDLYVFLRYGSRKSWWFNKIYILFMVTLVYLILAWGICIFIASFSLPINTNIGIDNEIILNHSVPFINKDFLIHNSVLILLIMFCLLFLSFFTLGLFLSVLSLFIKRSFIPFAIGILINFFSLLLIKFNFNFKTLDWFTGYKRMFLLNHDATFSIFNSHSTLNSILYWIILIIIIFCASLFILSKIDMSFKNVGENE